MGSANQDAGGMPFIAEFDPSLLVFDSSSSSRDSSEESSGEKSIQESSQELDFSSFEDSSDEDSSTISSCTTDSGSAGEERHPDGVPMQLEFTGEDIELVSDFMKGSGFSHAVGHLVERGNTMTSVNWLSAHVPTCVLDHLGMEVRRTTDFLRVSTAESLSGAIKEEDCSDVSELSDHGGSSENDDHNLCERGPKSPLHLTDESEYSASSSVVNRFVAARIRTTSDRSTPREEVMRRNIHGGSYRNGAQRQSFGSASDDQVDLKRHHLDASRVLIRNKSFASSNGGSVDTKLQHLSINSNPTQGMARMNLTNGLEKAELIKSATRGNFSNTNGAALNSKLSNIESSQSDTPWRNGGGGGSVDTRPRRLATIHDDEGKQRGFPVRNITRLSSTKSFDTNSVCTYESSERKSVQHAQRLIASSRQSAIDEEASGAEHQLTAVGELSIELFLALRRFGIGVGRISPQNGRPNRAKFVDPFPDDSDDDQPTVVNARSLNGSHGSLIRSTSKSTRWSERRRNAAAEELMSLPHASTYHAALLFVDISGFTKLATALAPEHLSKVINSYFQLIIDEVTSHGGDVLKFAGDGVFVEWKVATSRDNQSLMGVKKLSLMEALCAAATCGAKIVAKCSDFPVYAHNELGATLGHGAQVATLNVHCGLSVGQIVGVHVGDYASRREYVILGDPIDQVCRAVNAATLGEVAVSNQALFTLSKCCDMDKNVKTAALGMPAIIATRALSHFTPQPGMLPVNGNTSPLPALSQTMESWHKKALEKFRKLLSLYVHPVVVANESSNQDQPRSKNTVQERLREEAELRSVYVIFVTPLISVRVTGNKETDRHLYKLLNNIMNLTTRELARFKGHLRQFIVDDKGVVLIATFGLRGSTFPNMVSERALPATITIHNALQNELGVQNQVGATIGTTYCGLVGGLRRHEYAVMGPSVNLAARLMSSPKNPGILVDNAVRSMADKSYAFNALTPVKAKGYAEPVPIFEPLSPLERSWGRVQPNFVGRKKEIMTLMGIAREMALNQSPSKIIYVVGDSGMGKSTLVVHAIEHVRKLMSASRRRVIVTKHVSKESEKLVPFGIFRSILVNVLSYFKSTSIAQDERSYVSYASSQGLDSIGWESLSDCNFSASEASGLTRSADRLATICRELNAPAAFEELVGHHLLGVEYKSKTSVKSHPSPSNNMRSLVSFMAKAFKLCTQEANLVIVALDDAHHMDEMSWKVVNELFNTAANILFLCTSRPISTYKLLVGEEFWEELNGVHLIDGRFKLMKLERLEQKDIKAMIAKTLGLQEREVSLTVLNDVMMQSNGTPHFANEILETMKRRIGAKYIEGNSLGVEIAYGSVGELLLHRIDSFDGYVRNVLNLGAVLGSSFEMREVIAVLLQTCENEESDKKTLFQKAKGALDVAVSEGILYAVQEGGDFSEDGEDPMIESIGFNESYVTFGSGIGSGGSVMPLGDSITASGQLVYTFCHDIWRTTILNLMLDSRKRDMHKIIAKTLEKKAGRNKNDYLSRMKLFSHWKASGESKNAACCALSIGMSFDELGLQDQSINVFQDALDMWKLGGDISDSPGENLDELTVTDLECVIQVYIALAKCLANTHKCNESVAAYQNALRILQNTKAAEDIVDRSMLFPIFNGLFAALKFGQIEQDEDCTYEQSLVARFVYETRLHGDPVHYTGALAMQSEMYGRLGRFEKAIEIHDQLAEVYNVEEHSDEVVEENEINLSAHSFSMNAVWYAQLGETEKSIEICWHVLNELLPKMNPRCIHNTCMMIYPLLWILKEHGYAQQARDHFSRSVVDAFTEHFGEGRSTTFLPVFDPIMALLELASGSNTVNFEAYVEWALNEDNLQFGTVLNCALGNLGKCADSIAAEICFLVATRIEGSVKIKKKLVRSGLDIANEVTSLAEAKRLTIARNDAQKILEQLVDLAGEIQMTV